MSQTILFILCLASLVAGCAVKGDYSCGVPVNGVRCQPMDETHRQMQAGSLRSLNTDPFVVEEPTRSTPVHQGRLDDEEMSFGERPPLSRVNAVVEAGLNLPSIATIHSKQAILSQPRELRIWFSRFTDPEGDLHDESFVFVRISNGHWVIDNKPVLY